MTEPTASKTSPGSSDLFDRQVAALHAEAAARAAEHDATMAEVAELERELERRQTAAQARPQEAPPLRRPMRSTPRPAPFRLDPYWTNTNMWVWHPTPAWVQILGWIFVAYLVVFSLVEHF